ncbi:YPDG domain-containing protein, partial [Staphylococcus sp. SQ8-PEA]
TDAGQHDPGYEDQSTKPGTPVEVPQTKDGNLPPGTSFEGPKDVPPGWTVDVDPNTGKVTVTPPANATPDTKVNIPVVVHYPDGSTDTPTVTVTVVPKDPSETDAGQHDPGYEDQGTKPGVPVEVPQTKDGNLPPNTTFEGPKDVPPGWTVDVDPNTGKVTVTPPANATPDTKVNIPVVVHYPDGSTDTPTVTVTVVPKDPSETDAGQHDPGYDENSTKPGVPVEVPQTKDGNLPPGTTFEGPKDVPPGWTVDVDPKTGKVTVTPPANATPDTKVNIPVVVHYPDGSTDTPTVTVTVVPKDPSETDAGQHDPGYEDQGTKPGTPVEVPQTKDGNLPPGTTFEGPKDVPPGWTVDVDPNTGKVTVTPPANATPDTKVNIPVVVHYPDGSTDTPTVTVTVVPKDPSETDAGQHDPGYEDQGTKPGTPVEVPQTKDGNLPPGTTFEGPKDVPPGWTVDVDPNTGKVTVTPPADATPDTKVNIPVVVHYPDGSTDTPTVTVTVVPKDPSETDAGQHDPGYDENSTKPGVPVEVPQTKDGNLPPNTTFEGPKDVPPGWTVDVDPNTGKVTVTP